MARTLRVQLQERFHSETEASHPQADMEMAKAVDWGVFLMTWYDGLIIVLFAFVYGVTKGVIEYFRKK